MKYKEKQIDEMEFDLTMLVQRDYYGHILFNETAEKLIEQGYRKIDKDSVVLSRKEYENLLATPLNVMGDLVISKIKNKDYELVKKENYDKLCHLAYFGYEDVKEQTRKETAEKIFNALIGYTMEEDGWTWCISAENIQELAKQFNVEIKE